VHPSFGGSGLIPVSGDYDGDGKTDVAVYQTSTGHWFLVGSTDGFMQHLSFGGSGFIPVPGDYDGDGKTDTAVYNTTNGNWFIAQSTEGFRIHSSFGGGGFVPVLPQVTILRALGLL
jgi:spore coat protein A, manganese oxidase